MADAALPLEQVGVVEGFFARASAAVIKLKKGIKQGERLYIKGHTTDLQQVVESMQINHQEIAEANKGSTIGLLVRARVRPNDVVYRISEK